MSPLGVLVVTAIAMWLVLLTIATLVLVRQLAILSYRLQHLGSLEPKEGLALGSPVPEAITRAIQGARFERTYVLLTSAGCAPCQLLVPQLARLQVDAPTVALLPGQGPIADQMAGAFPTWVRVIRDPEATALAEALHIDRTPFVFELAAGMVTAKTYIHSVADISRLISGYRPMAEPRAVIPLEVRHADADLS